MPKISVVIPSYNHGKFLKRAIDSVLNQTYQDFEIVILDDCSKDNSKEIIDSYNDSRIRKYFSLENNGAVDTLNQLIDLANGEYIAILNSDDYWEDVKLEKQLNYLEKHNEIAACFTWADLVDEADNLIYNSSLNIFQKRNCSQNEWLRYFFDNGNCLCHPSVLIKKCVYDEIGKYSKVYRQLPDFEFWIRLIKKYNIHIIEENLTHFRLLNSEVKNSSFLSKENLNLLVYEINMIKNNFFNDCDPHLFCDAFKDQIKNKKCLHDSVMLSFEMALVLFNSKYYPQIGRFVGYSKLGSILSKEQNADLINSNYKFTIFDYYKLGEKFTKIDSVLLDVEKVEVLPNYIKNSHYYKLRNRLVKIVNKLRR